MDKVTTDFRKWTLVCEIYKNAETLAAIVTVDGAWMDTIARKVIMPPEDCKNLFDKAPKTDSFQVL
jgi:acyl-CoA thioester hydrolase